MCQSPPFTPRLVRVLLALLLPIGARAQLDYATPYSFYTLAGNSSIGSADDGGGRFNEPNGVAVDFTDSFTNGGLTVYTFYVADTANCTIRKLPRFGKLITFAGSAGSPGSADGAGGDARFAFPKGLVVDSSGNVYVIDSLNYTVRKITPNATVSTWAGTAGLSGSADGTGGSARFGYLQGVTIDPAGNLFVADGSNHTIRKITPAGVVTTLAGSAGSTGSADGTGGAARFNNPHGLHADATGNLFVADQGNHTIRKITPAGVVSTFAGLPGTSGSADGTGSSARFNSPTAVAVDAGGNVYVTDGSNQTIRKITPAGTVSTLAGSVLTVGATDASGGAARFYNPQGIAVDASGALYVADTGNHSIRSVTPTGEVSTRAGLSGGAGSTDGTGGAARFRELYAAAVSPAGDIFLADRNNSTIRKVAANSVVTTFAGTAGLTGSNNGTGTGASFNQPSGVAFDAGGNLYVSDTLNHLIRKITTAGAVTTLAGTAGSPGGADGTGATARFAQPSGVAVDASGNVYVADLLNATIRKITPAGLVTTLAGTPGVPGHADGTGAAARFTEPRGVATDTAGNVYVADFADCVVRKITPAGVVTTLAGLAGTPGDVDGSGAAARFGPLSNLAVDPAGNVLVADTANNLVRKITPGGTVTTLAGFAGLRGNHDGIGPEVTFDYPRGLALDATGNLYVASGTALRKGQLAGPPVIISQPQSVTMALGQIAIFSVTVSNPPLSSIQWYFNGTPIDGATSFIPLGVMVKPTSAGDYTVVVTNPLGSATSNKATLTVSAATTPTSSSGGNSGGGGGAPSGWFILALFTLAAARSAELRKVRNNT